MMVWLSFMTNFKTKFPLLFVIKQMAMYPVVYIITVAGMCNVNKRQWFDLLSTCMTYRERSYIPNSLWLPHFCYIHLLYFMKTKFCSQKKSLCIVPHCSLQILHWVVHCILWNDWLLRQCIHWIISTNQVCYHDHALSGSINDHLFIKTSYSIEMMLSWLEKCCTTNNQLLYSIFLCIW